MAVVPHTVDIVVADMSKALRFYEAPGLSVLETRDDEDQMQITTPGDATRGFVTERRMREVNPHWEKPVGQRVTFACRCDSPEEVDAVYARVTGSGYEGRQDPWDAVWGQRYAILSDADGNRVDLFAAIKSEGEE